LKRRKVGEHRQTKREREEKKRKKWRQEKGSKI